MAQAYVCMEISEYPPGTETLIRWTTYEESKQLFNVKLTFVLNGFATILLWNRADRFALFVSLVSCDCYGCGCSLRCYWCDCGIS